MPPSKPIAAALAFAVLAIARPGSAEPKDAQAQATLKAIEEDFLETKFDAAEQKLRDAIEACGQTMCSASVKAELYAALAGVLANGKKELGDAKDAFVEGLKLDKTLKPLADLQSSEVDFVYGQARKELKLDAPPPPPEKPQPKPAAPSPKSPCEACADDPSACPPGCAKKPTSDIPVDENPSGAEARAPGKKKSNWVSIAFEPDVSLVGGNDLCTQSSQSTKHIVCFRQNGSQYAGTPTIGNGDNVATGFALGTMRVVVGYDRLVKDNFSIGARVGFTFLGPTQSGASYLPIHAELRGAVWPTVDPFARTGVRPFLFASAGVSEVDAKVDVEVLEDGAACGASNPASTNSPCTKPNGKDGVVEAREQTLTSYKQAGPGFASLGFGFLFAPVTAAGFEVGVRATAEFPNFTFAITPEAGFELGF